MFNNSADDKDNVSFSDAYKSEILGGQEDEPTSGGLAKIVIITLLIVLIVGVGIFGYLYLNDAKASGTLAPLPKASPMIDNIDDLLEEENSSTDIDQEIKSKTTPESPNESNETVEILEPVSTQKGEETYLEQLAELSKEIDGEH